MESIRTVTVCGLGTMGSWIAPKIAAHGFNVLAYDKQAAVRERFLIHIKQTHSDRIRVIDDLKDAVATTDFLLETIVEDLEEKRTFFLEIDNLLRANTIVTSNTSIFLPTQFLANFQHKSRFSCFHFYSPNTAVDIMPLPETDPAVVNQLREFATAIGEKPIVLKRMSPGYVFSAMAGAATDVALDLAAAGTADVATIDSAWKAVTGMPLGPFGMLDMIGLDTSLRIRKQRLLAEPDNLHLKRGIALLERHVNEGRLGRKTKHGFFDYENS